MTHKDEVYIEAAADNFGALCLSLHKEHCSPVMGMFARELKDDYRIYCAFISVKLKKWFFATLDIPKDNPQFPSIAKEIYSANLFEREIREMFGINPIGNPDNRRLRLHEEVWPKGSFPLRKDFVPPKEKPEGREYPFAKVEGEGVFEVPVGPVHAGIIGPGHFRFSVAGEPIVNLELRLGFSHRGVEKLLENKIPSAAVRLTECVAGDSAVAHSWAFCHAVEKIGGIKVPERAAIIRAILLELERMYNHVADIGGMAKDVGFSHPAALASIIKESIHSLNQRLTGSRFLKGINVIGGVARDIGNLDGLDSIMADFKDLKGILLSSVSFLDRVEPTGILRRETAENLGVTGLAGRASGIAIDLRQGFMETYNKLDYKLSTYSSGDCLARLKIRIDEFEGSAKLIRRLLENLPQGEILASDINFKEGYSLGYVEGWRGPVLYWVNLDGEGKIDRCKIIDPSFRSWQGLSYAVLGEIIPDFPLCNKSFDLSYPGGDL